jgi:hypothetical protein
MTILLQQIIKDDFSVLEPHVDDLVSMIMTIYCIFIGNYKLKNKILCLIVSILENVRKRLPTLSPEKVESLLSLRLFEALLYSFDDMNSFEREEAAYVRRVLKESPGSNTDIEGVPRREVEKLVYAKRALT